MEFIPLDKYSKSGLKSKKRTRAEASVTTTPKREKLSKDNEERPLKKGKHKPQPKIIDKKNVKNKFRETLALKKKKKIRVKKTVSKDEEENEEDEELGEELEEENDNNQHHDDDESEGEPNEADKNDESDDEEAFKKKCQALDEKKKNRLFLKLKKKIYSEGEIKQLHPDIKSVIFPRKKKSRWCWAVFVSEERADDAMKQLIKNKDVFVSKPNPHDKVIMKTKEKLKTVLRKKEAKKKLQKMWV